MAAHARTSLLIATLLALSGASRAEAQVEAPAPTAEESEWAVSGSLAGGAMVSDDQTSVLGFGGGGGSVHLGVSVRPFASLGVDWLEGQLSGGLTLVGPGVQAPGGVVDVQLGVRLAPRLGDVRPYLGVGAGVGFTGPLTRPVGSVSVGIELAFGEEITLAPEVSLLHVLQDDGPQQSDDAVFVSLGLHLTFRPVSHAPVAPEVEVQVERVETIVTEDRFVLEPTVPVAPADMADLLSLVDRAVPGSSLQVIVLVPPVLFEHDETALTPAGEVSMHDVLDRIRDASPSTHVVVEGHADQTGESAHNLAISRARAATVSAWLVTHGLPRARIRETGEGATQPLVLGEDTATLAPNRRVTIRLETDAAPAATETSATETQETP